MENGKIKLSAKAFEGPLMSAFNDQDATLTGTKGKSGETTLVNLTKMGTGLFLRDDQFEVVN